MRTDELPHGLQILESHGADFENMLWQFQLGVGDRVWAGRFVVMPYESFTEFNVRLQSAQRILRSLQGSANLNNLEREVIEGYFDPKPL